MNDIEIMERPVNTQLSTDLCKEIIGHLFAGLKSFQQAGDLLVHALTIDSRAKDRIIELEPRIDMQLLNQFEKIGRRQLCPELTISEAPGVRALRKMPYSDQVRFSKEPIEMLIVNDTDSTSQIMVSVYAMTFDQARQVFDHDEIRSIGKQRAWIESNKRRPAPPAPLKMDGDYTISRGKVIFNKPCTLDQAALIRLLNELGSK